MVFPKSEAYFKARTRFAFLRGLLSFLDFFSILLFVGGVQETQGLDFCKSRNFLLCVLVEFFLSFPW